MIVFKRFLNFTSCKFCTFLNTCDSCNMTHMIHSSSRDFFTRSFFSLMCLFLNDTWVFLAIYSIFTLDCFPTVCLFSHDFYLRSFLYFHLWCFIFCFIPRPSFIFMHMMYLVSRCNHVFPPCCPRWTWAAFFKDIYLEMHLGMIFSHVITYHYRPVCRCSIVATRMLI